MTKMRVIDTPEVTTAPTCNGYRPGNWQVFCAVETPGATQNPLWPSWPKKHGTAPRANTTGCPMGWTLTPFTKAPTLDGLGQGLEHSWIISNNRPVFASNLLQLINGKPAESGVYGLIMAAAVILCGRPTEQDQDLDFVSPKGIQQHFRRGIVRIDHEVRALD